MGLTIAGTADALNAQARVYSGDITQKLRQNIILENIMTPVKCDYSYVDTNVNHSDIIQAFQCQFTPKGDAVLDAVENKLQAMKIDIQFTCDQLEDLRDTYFARYVEDGKAYKDYKFPQYIYDEVVIPKLYEELELSISYKGVRVAPTIGTPGATSAAADGLGKKIADAITASILVPITTGALVAATVVDQIELFCDSLPLPYRDMPGLILASPTIVKMYLRAYRGEFGTGNGVLGNENRIAEIDYTNKKLVAVPAMEGSGRILFTTKNNLIVGSKTGTPFYPAIRWQEHDRVLKGLAEFDRFYGVRYWGNVFVNDQA